MPDYYISLHLHTSDAARVRQAVGDVFTERGFTWVADDPASVVTEDDDALPEGDDWYGVVVSGRSGAGWVSVYVDDWADSGLLARELSRALAVPALEVWVAEDVHWGCTYFFNGDVQARFADAPDTVADTPEEAAAYRGDASAFTAVLTMPASELQAAFAAAQEAAGTFAGPGVDALCQAVGLPFEHAFTGYEFFFSDDPDDYGPSLQGWRGFRHLSFRPPAGRDTLAE